MYRHLTYVDTTLAIAAIYTYMVRQSFFFIFRIHPFPNANSSLLNLIFFYYCFFVVVDMMSMHQSDLLGVYQGVHRVLSALVLP